MNTILPVMDGLGAPILPSSEAHLFGCAALDKVAAVERPVERKLNRDASMLLNLSRYYFVV